MNSIVLSQGVWLDYVELGSRLGVPVLFLHGFTDSRRSFDRVMGRLPGSIYGIALSLRGHGDSDRPEHGYSPVELAADVAEFMDRMGFEQAIIVGHSMGATVAQRFALSYPNRTLGLILIGSFYRIKDHPGAVEFWESTVSRLEDPIDPEIVRGFQLSTVASPLPEAFLDLVVRESLKVPAALWKTVFRQLLATDFTPELAAIRVPALLLWGDQDVFVSQSEQDQLLRVIPSSTLSVYRGVGHSPHWEDPIRCAREISDFAWQF
jgi:non-heme chloroperoxidase